LGRSYRDLTVWQLSMDLVDAIYDMTENFPKREIFGLSAQMRRAAVSIPSNIAEGQSRLSAGPFRLFLGHARGSLAELSTQIEIARRRSLISEENWAQLIGRCDKVGKLLNGLLESIKDRP
jgi:four helix bundle protein